MQPGTAHVGLHVADLVTVQLDGDHVLLHLDVPDREEPPEYAPRAGPRPLRCDGLITALFLRFGEVD